MPNTARPIETLPGMPDAADLRECASRRPPITYQQLLAERAGRSAPGRTGTDRANRNQRGEQNRSTSAFSLGTLPIDERPEYSRNISVAIVLPWSTLLTDNNRQAWVGTRMMTTKEYKLAKQKAVDAIETQISDTLPGWLLASGWQPLFSAPVAIAVSLIEPNRSAKRDLLNYQKLICDAMSGIVYADDSLIDDAHFTRGTPDIDRPRADITVRPIGAPR